ncbi:hypothetical protein [Pseudoxanthomonas yeongjuensis]|uniref:hypothetical protein n=1 Tax=Pseudoxanthomonas yeongjuensis TaxID=377616 RepID=UPI001FE2BD2B|nr:hypothetical protein [Pseudoxanthomonas yeongjuensis]
MSHPMLPYGALAPDLLWSAMLGSSTTPIRFGSHDTLARFFPSGAKTVALAAWTWNALAPIRSAIRAGSEAWEDKAVVAAIKAVSRPLRKEIMIIRLRAGSYGRDRIPPRIYLDGRVSQKAF